MSIAARHYAQTASAAMAPRELEASALLKAAARLQAASETAGGEAIAAHDALDHNRRLWTLFAGSVSDPASALPDEIRARVLALADFVFNHTILAQARQEPGDLAVLIRINRELAAGLRGGR